MEAISILGSGWLGYPLAQHFISAGYTVKASTTSENRVAELKSIGADPFIVDINSLSNDVQNFLQANILIVNITSKNVAGFRHLVKQIEASEVESVMFVSSTSVYENVKKTITETDYEYFSRSPLLEIEDLFKSCINIRTTIVRFGGLIGYSRHPGRFFSPATIIQNPDSPVNIIHRDDCIEILSQIIQQHAWGEVLNCCADTHPSKREFYTLAVDAIGGVLPGFGKSDPGCGKLISNRKVKQLLNYEFKWPDLMAIDFEESA